MPGVVAKGWGGKSSKARRELRWGTIIELKLTLVSCNCRRTTNQTCGTSTQVVSLPERWSGAPTWSTAYPTCWAPTTCVPRSTWRAGQIGSFITRAIWWPAGWTASGESATQTPSAQRMCSSSTTPSERWCRMSTTSTDKTEYDEPGVLFVPDETIENHRIVCKWVDSFHKISFLWIYLH